MSHINQESPVVRGMAFLMGLGAMLIALMTLASVLSEPAGALTPLATTPTPTRTPYVPPQPPITIGVAGTPLTGKVAFGQDQLIRVKAGNTKTYAQTVTVTHTSPWALQSIDYQINTGGAKTSTGTCPNTGCAAFTLDPGQAVIVFYHYQRQTNPQDWVGPTTGCAKDSAGIEYCAKEQKSLP